MVQAHIADLGHGIGLRRPSADALLEPDARKVLGVDFLEILVENYAPYGGRLKRLAEQAAEQYPIVLHGVGLSVGGPDPLDARYLESLNDLARRTGALWFTDHVCWSSGFGVEYHDLLPLPFTEEAASHVARRLREAQSRVCLPLGLENPSYYVKHPDAPLSEVEFLNALLEEADCGLLLDVNNVYVNARNHGYDPYAFIDALPAERVWQVHLAGHFDRGDVLIDTHGAAMTDDVLDLYRHTLRRTGGISTLFEWDNDLPPLSTVLVENDRARAAAHDVLGPRSLRP